MDYKLHISYPESNKSQVLFHVNGIHLATYHVTNRAWAVSKFLPVRQQAAFRRDLNVLLRLTNELRLLDPNILSQIEATQEMGKELDMGKVGDGKVGNMHTIKQDQPVTPAVTAPVPEPTVKPVVPAVPKPIEPVGNTAQPPVRPAN